MLRPVVLRKLAEWFFDRRPYRKRQFASFLRDRFAACRSMGIRQSEYSHNVSKLWMTSLCEQLIIAVRAITTRRYGNILHAIHSIGYRRGTDPTAEIKMPQLGPSLGSKGIEIAIHLSGKYEISGRR